MDLQPNKIDGMYLPITNTRISASEWNQLVGSCMAFITEAGLTPDAEDNEQFLNAFKTIAAGLEIVGANTNLSNLTATGEARFTTKADTDLGNVSADGKATAIGWGMPDYSAGIQITGSASFTCPSAGFVTIQPVGGTSGIVYVNGNRVGIGSNSAADASVNFIVSKNDVITIGSGYSFGTESYFYPLKGAN